MELVLGRSFWFAGAWTALENIGFHSNAALRDTLGSERPLGIGPCEDRAAVLGRNLSCRMVVEGAGGDALGRLS